MSLPKQIDIRGSDGQGADERQKVTTPQNTALVINDDGNIEAVDGGSLADIRNANLGRLNAETQFDAAPAASAEALVLISGTGTELYAREATGGILLTTEVSTPVADDNVLVVGVVKSGFVAPITAVSKLIFNANIMLPAIADILVAVGLDENPTNPATDATAGEGAVFLFDPGSHTDETGTDANWQIHHKVNGVDTYTDTDIAVVANTTYKLRIEIGADLKAVYFINDIKVATGPALTSGDSVSVFAGFENRTTAQTSLAIRSLSLSRGIG